MNTRGYRGKRGMTIFIKIVAPPKIFIRYPPMTSFFVQNLKIALYVRIKYENTIYDKFIKYYYNNNFNQIIKHLFTI